MVARRSRARKDCGFPRCVFLPQHVVLIENMQTNFGESFFVTPKLVGIVPSHSIHVCQSDFFCQLVMVLVQERIKLFELQEVLLLHDLRVDVW